MQLTAEKIVELLEAHKSFHGLYFYLGGLIAFSESPEVRGGAAAAGLCRRPACLPGCRQPCPSALRNRRSYVSPSTLLSHLPPSPPTPKQVHYKYIEAAAKTGQLKEVERATRESNFYPADRVKTFLMEARGGVLLVCVLSLEIL